MSRIAVITDSNSGINFEDAKELGIKVLPMPFLIDGKTYFEEISLSQEEFFEKLENDVDILYTYVERSFKFMPYGIDAGR